MAGVSCLAFFFDVSAAFESIGTDRVPIFDRPVSGRETLSQLVFVLALHFVQHLPPSLPFSVLALSLLRISIIPDPTGSPWMPMTVRGCVPLCMYLDNENAFTAFFFDVSAAFESIGTDIRNSLDQLLKIASQLGSPRPRPPRGTRSRWRPVSVNLALVEL